MLDDRRRRRRLSATARAAVVDRLARRRVRGRADARTRRSPGGHVLIQLPAAEMTIRIRVIADDHALFRQGLKSMLQLQPDVDGGRRAGARRRHPADARPDPVRRAAARSPDGAQRARRHRDAGGARRGRRGHRERADRGRARGDPRRRARRRLQALRDRDADDGGPHGDGRPRLAAAGAPGRRSPQACASRRRRRSRGASARSSATSRSGCAMPRSASSLVISEVTVKTHLNNIFQKLGMRDRVELTLYAVRTGIIGVHERRR